jgi:hypothetical protein
MGAIVPHRRPTPDGGGASTPVSSRGRCCARREGKLGGENCSQFKGEAGELEGEEDSTATKLATAAGRAALRRGRGAAPTGSGDENLQPIELDEPLVNPKRRKGRRWRWSFTCGDECTTAAGTRGGGAGELGLEQASGCAGKAMGGAGDRARV